MHHFDVNFSKFWRKNMNSLYVNLVRRIFFSYKFSVQKTCIDYLKMYSECTILMQFLKKFPGEAPRTPTCGRGDPPPPPSPFRRFAPQWSLRLHWSLVPPRQWRFWIRPCWITQSWNVVCTQIVPTVCWCTVLITLWHFCNPVSVNNFKEPSW